MQKILSIVLALLLLMAFAPGVLAAEEEVEAPALSEFTLENAWELISYYGWEGVTGSIAQVSLQFWRPATLQKVDLAQKMSDAGYLAGYLAADSSFYVILQDYGIDLEEYQGIIEESGFENIRAVSVNGRAFVIYDEPQENGTFCRVAATQETDGKILEFVFYYESDDAENVEDVGILFDVVIATVRDAKESQ